MVGEGDIHAYCIPMLDFGASASYSQICLQYSPNGKGFRSSLDMLHNVILVVS